MKGKKIIVSALAATMVAAPIATLNSVGNKAYADTLEENYTVLGPGFSVSRADYPAKANKNKAVKFLEVIAYKVISLSKVIFCPTLY